LLTGRLEWVDKNELFTDVPSLEDRAFRIGAYTIGYSREVGTVAKALQTALGANVSFYSVPDAISPYYGAHPWGVDVFMRLRLKQPH
jgi:hypothetical protein